MPSPILNARPVLPAPTAPAAQPWLPSYPVAYDQLCSTTTSLSLSSADSFTLFPTLPPELRLVIWQHTWEHRQLIPQRKIIGWITDGRTYSSTLTNHEIMCIKIRDTKKARYGWFSNNHASVSGSVCASTNGISLITRTWTETPAPTSLYVNRESHYETLRYFQRGLGLSSNKLDVWVNFDRDVIHVPVHSPLHMTFTRADCGKLVRLTIPELAPALSLFSHRIGQWDSEKSRLSAIPTLVGTLPLYEEFTDVWRLIRSRFPSLREINLDRFAECRKYELTSMLGLDRPLPPGHLYSHCHYCMNLQQRIRQNIPRIGVAHATDGALSDISRILDARNIMNPLYERRSAVIGKVKGQKKGEMDEDVVVNYWTV
ncbi:hypothetical protein BKA67DRAFT_581653 [Truncatella angustata]|uniref:2EXR domain-containing protein n=1 Tax=Truncatella angustata TaxID=152316 RepID=A0A9P8RMU1_9PEZI|nr:uncharacterized protein BKA67DRAFT_581653 [Truncatella angustata]KAH6647098.1 hypothetical protein BKA67DRAFT_581653 [Truncatella angustata]